MYGTRHGGRPSQAEIAKGIPHTGDGTHEHGDFGPHQHGEPSFADAEVAYLEGHGYHVDRDHGQVYAFNGRHVPPLVVSQVLAGGRSHGVLKGGSAIAEAVAKAAGSGISAAAAAAASGPDEVQTVIQVLNLRTH